MSKKSKRLAVPEVSTEWMDICRSLNKEYRLAELREMAHKALKINTSRFNKRQLCMLLSVQFAKLKEPPKKHRSGCKNESISELESFDEYGSNTYIKDQYGYCFFPLEILRLIGENNPHPYNRQPLNMVKTHDRKKTLEQAALEFPTQIVPLEVEAIHRERQVRRTFMGLTYNQRQALDKLVTELSIIEKRVCRNGDCTYHAEKNLTTPISAEDIVNAITLPDDLGALKAELEDNPLIRELSLDKYFRQEGSILNFLNNTLKALRETRTKYFDQLQPLKNLILRYIAMSGPLELPSPRTSPRTDTLSEYDPTQSEIDYYDMLQAQAESMLE